MNKEKATINIKKARLSLQHAAKRLEVDDVDKAKELTKQAFQQIKEL